MITPRLLYPPLGSMNGHLSAPACDTLTVHLLLQVRHAIPAFWNTDAQNHQMTLMYQAEKTIRPFLRKLQALFAWAQVGQLRPAH